MSTPRFNKTGIDWCGWSWNPVCGCSNHCQYCYARAVARRLPCPQCQAFMPHFHPERLAAPVNTRIPNLGPNIKIARLSRVFLGSMTDLWGDGVSLDWLVQIANAIKDTPSNWQYLVLTKHPKRMARHPILPKHNVMFGFTNDGISSPAEADECMFEMARLGYHCFVSCEPLLSPVRFTRLSEWCSWLIIGPQTKPLKQPDPRWVESLIAQAKEACVPVWTKDKLLGQQIRQEPKERT